jgi:hypothetical protein
MMRSVFRLILPVNLALVLLFINAFDAVAGEPEKWFLMARHGECAEISSLERKIPNLNGVVTLDAFLGLMKSRGYSTSQQPLALPEGSAVEVSVSEFSLNLIFVKAGLCSVFVEHQ